MALRYDYLQNQYLRLGQKHLHLRGTMHCFSSRLLVAIYSPTFNLSLYELSKSIQGSYRDDMHVLCTRVYMRVIVRIFGIEECNAQ